MRINNPNDLYNFLMGHNLTGTSPEAQNVIACVDILIRMCACDPQEARTARYNQCVQTYINFASKAPTFKHFLLPKTDDGKLSFYMNNQLIGEITR